MIDNIIIKRAQERALFMRKKCFLELIFLHFCQRVFEINYVRSCNCVGIQPGICGKHLCNQDAFNVFVRNIINSDFAQFDLLSPPCERTFLGLFSSLLETFVLFSSESYGIKYDNTKNKAHDSAFCHEKIYFCFHGQIVGTIFYVVV